MSWQIDRLSERQKNKMMKAIMEDAWPKLTQMTIEIKGVKFTSDMVKGVDVARLFLNKKPVEKSALVKLNKDESLTFQLTNLAIMVKVERIDRSDADRTKDVPEEGNPNDESYPFPVDISLPENPHTGDRWISEEEYVSWCKDNPEEAMEISSAYAQKQTEKKSSGVPKRDTSGAKRKVVRRSR